MSVESVLARIAEIGGAPQPRTPPPATTQGGSFASVLAGQSVANGPLAGTAATMPVGWNTGGGSGGMGALQAAPGEGGPAAGRAGGGGPGRAAAGLRRLGPDRHVPSGHGGQRHRPVVRLLRLVGRRAGR